MATVHFARLQGAAGFARSVAIKRLHRQFANDPDFVAMFVDEARLAARITHPNVVPTLDVVSQGDELLLVMEYVSGSSLARLVRTTTQRGEHVPPRIAAAIVAGVLRGLHAAHEAKSENGAGLEIVHRDVSPQNVLVGTDGIARVLDFGVAKAAGRLQSTRQGQLKGKIAYMAPEQITTGKVTRRTDLYAASVVLWETLTGQRLFRADNEARLLSMVLAGEVPPPSVVAEWVPQGFDAVVQRGAERDPAKRFATAREMAAAVEAVAGTAPPAEVGEWVERVAADELRERANRIEEIERSLHTSPSRSIARPARQLPDAAPPVVRDRPSHVSHIAMASARSVAVMPIPEPSSSRAKKTRVVIAAAVAAVCTIGVTMAALRGPDAKTATLAVPIAPAQPQSVTPSAPLAPEATWTAVPQSTWTAIPQSTWTAIPTGSATDAPPAFAPPSLPLKLAKPPSPAAKVAKPPVFTKPLTVVVAKPDCTPPYIEDGKGHIHFKAACVN